MKKLNLEAWPLIPTEGWEILCKHANLESLNLASCKWLTDAYLKDLVFLPNLSEINLKDCKGITSDGILALRKEIFKRTGREITIVQ